jgi:hypothetical protein
MDTIIYIVGSIVVYGVLLLCLIVFGGTVALVLHDKWLEFRYGTKKWTGL